MLLRVFKQKMCLGNLQMGAGHIFLINSKLSAARGCYLHGVVLARTLTSPPLQNEGKEPWWPLQPPQS